MELQYGLTLHCGDRRIDVDDRGLSLAIVGYAGRDAAAVRAHIDELASHGVPAPSEVPSVWNVPRALATQDERVRARAGATSGEIEPVLVLLEKGAFVTVGSDHTDRDLERTSMTDAKVACSKVIGRACWAVADVADRWDELRLTSEVFVDGQWAAYQEGDLVTLRPLEWYLARFESQAPVVVFCGTVPAHDGLVTNATAFRGSLEDRKGTLGRLEVDYAIDDDE